SRWSPRGAPVRSLIIQGVVILAYLVGTSLVARAFQPTVAASTIGMAGSPMAFGPLLATTELFVETQPRGLQNILYWINLTAGLFFFFFLLTGVALFVLRVKEPNVPRPFRVPLYPVLPIIFCASCAYMVVNSPKESLYGMLVLLAGLPL